MIDQTTRRPLRVSTDGTAGPYISVPYMQLDEVRRLLDSRGIGYLVEKDFISLDVISLNGGSGMAVVDLGRGSDPNAVQAILDSAP